MLNFYILKIQQGKMTLEDVPSRWYEAVRLALEEKKKNQ